MKSWKATTVPFLRMAKQALEKPTRWKEGGRKTRLVHNLLDVILPSIDLGVEFRILYMSFIALTLAIFLQNGEFPSDAGVIPRAVRQIFDTLEAQNAEYSMKVTFLELYNEEISDLLAPEENSRFIDDKLKKPIALMEDGKGGVFVRGLEEEIVTTANEIYKILDKGSAKRRTAETLLNKQSSRSHSIFSITIHIKECTPEGEEMIKCGKLNLVDLAGSENISRSGAREVLYHFSHLDALEDSSVLLHMSIYVCILVHLLSAFLFDLYGD